MRKRLQIFCLLLLPCLTLMGILGRGSPAALSTSSDAAILSFLPYTSTVRPLSASYRSPR